MLHHVRDSIHPTRRERSRLSTVVEIKATALAIMREQGATDVKFTDIARAMGMTAPALYRYFADRDELLTALIVDGYRSLSTRIAADRDAVDPADLGGRWLAVATAYRVWAREEPEQFALVLGLPVPGYSAPDEGPTTEAAAGAMDQLASLFVSAATEGSLGEPLIKEVSDALAQSEKLHHDGLDKMVPPASFQAMLLTWSMLHGFASLEAYGHLEWLTEEGRDALFLSQVRLAARAAGIPEPPA